MEVEVGGRPAGSGGGGSGSGGFAAVAAEEEEEEGGVEGGTGAAELEGDEDRDYRVPPLSEWWGVFRTLQTAEVWRAHGTWVTAHAPCFGPGVSERFAGAAGVKRTDVAAAEATRRAIARRVDHMLRNGGVLFLPSVPGGACPLVPVSAQRLPACTRRLLYSLRLIVYPCTLAASSSLAWSLVPVPAILPAVSYIACNHWQVSQRNTSRVLSRVSCKPAREVVFAPAPGPAE